MCPERESNPYGHHWPRDFLATLAFTQAISERCCSLDYFFTMPLCGLGVACIVSTPFISLGLNLVSHRHICRCRQKGFCLLGQFYFTSFPMSTLLFRPRYVSVNAWQLGQSIERFSNLWS